MSHSIAISRRKAQKSTPWWGLQGLDGPGAVHTEATRWLGKPFTSLTWNLSFPLYRTKQAMACPPTVSRNPAIPLRNRSVNVPADLFSKGMSFLPDRRDSRSSCNDGVQEGRRESESRISLGSVWALSLTSGSSSERYSLPGKAIRARVVFPDCRGPQDSHYGVFCGGLTKFALEFSGYHAQWVRSLYEQFKCN